MVCTMQCNEPHTKNLCVPFPTAKTAVTLLLMAILAIAGLAVAIPARAFAATGFKDVPDSHWIVKEGYLAPAVAEGLITGGKNADGSSNGMFYPENNITRAEVATILYRAVFPASKETTDPAHYTANTTVLHDVSDGMFYTAAVNWAFEEGIITGDKNPDGSLKGTFRPNNTISRQDFALILSRFANGVGKAGDGSYQALPDAGKVSGYAVSGVDWCFTNGVITGKGKDGAKKLDPQARATRAEATKMCYVTVHLFEKSLGYSASEARARVLAPALLADGPGFSKSGLVYELKTYGFSDTVAKNAVNAQTVNWNEQAARAAASYLSAMEFTRAELINRLESDGFSNAQAVYGVDHCGASW